ncbi:hypothetical protein COT47_01965 [Candidatus Woesearchaeota archaeon CG08_land_8_20_14_0_20_43_7]|nr:MAG: hypothetical protein COT47_01965 [Candidatus Woesearchaeota archaeon CG08_land_8_20_14_0_20_43_7]
MNEKNIELCEYGYRKTSAPSMLASGGYGPCVVIGMYDRKTKTGYMIHEPHIHFSDLEAMIVKIIDDAGNASRLKIVTSGNALFFDEDIDMEDLRRHHDEVKKQVTETLEKYFNKRQIEYRWLSDGESDELILDINTGKFYSAEEFDEEFL